MAWPANGRAAKAVGDLSFKLGTRTVKKIELGNLAASMSYIGAAVKAMQLNRTLIHQGHVSHQEIALAEYAQIVHAVDVIAKVAADLELRSVQAACRRAKSSLEQQFRQLGGYRAEALGMILDPLHQLLAAVADELSGVEAFAVTGRSGRFLAASEPPFGKIVAKAFPNIQDDLQEARAALALDRATACVFHLMRAMEAAVQRLASQMGVNNTEREWGKLLSDLAKKIEVMPKGRLRDAWSENHSLLYHVKQAWRNDVMHPKRSYSPQEAGRIYDAVESYLVQLSELLQDLPAPVGEEEG